MVLYLLTAVRLRKSGVRIMKENRQPKSNWLGRCDIPSFVAVLFMVDPYFLLSFAHMQCLHHVNEAIEEDGSYCIYGFSRASILAARKSRSGVGCLSTSGR
ncbi:hypothetical protein AAHA92_06557 [Salvia divinorum]|uniref:Uncharacterized protein n=1 Tax=Salvia divinorum TaxID=28513 RepID=A0ABD1I622_SALDI